MNLNFPKAIVAFSFVLLSLNGFTQDFQGKAYYQTKTTMDIDQWGGRQLSVEQKKRFEERMKSWLEKQYILTFNKLESIYKEDEKLDAIGSSNRWGGFASSFSEGPKYKNVKDKVRLVDQEFFGKKFLITDELETLVWKMGTETKTIGNYTCFKATATKTVNKFDWRSMRRRSPNEDKKIDSSKTAKESDDPMDDIEVPDTIEVVAWYTPQIPINQGPDDFWGLPGLILEVSADKTTMLCTKIVMNPEEKEDIDKPTKGQVVTQKEYTEIITKKMQEMRDMYGGRRGQGRRN